LNNATFNNNNNNNNNNLQLTATIFVREATASLPTDRNSAMKYTNTGRFYSGKIQPLYQLLAPVQNIGLSIYDGVRSLHALLIKFTFSNFVYFAMQPEL
jgi:hypothetical protein